MRSSLAFVLIATAALGCRRDEPYQAPSAKTLTHAEAATGERAGFEQLAIELSAKSACDRLRGQFRALPDREEAPAGTVGTVWIRDCLAVVSKDQVTFTIAGHAWRRTPRDLSVVEFTERSDGHLTAAYDGAQRTVTVKYEPSLPDTFTVLPVRGGAQADASLGEGIVSAIAMGLVAPGGRLTMANSPLSPRQGVTVQVPMCTGIPTFTFGLDPLTPASTDARATIDLRTDAPTLFGPLPQTAREVTVLAIRGRTKVDFLCEQDAVALAKRFVENGKLGAIKAISSKEVRGSGSVAIPTANCRVTMLARASSPRARTTMSWYLATAELPAVDAAPLRCSEPKNDDDDLRRAP